MKKIFIWCLVLILGKVAFDQFTANRSEKNVDKNMARIVEEMNQKLPQTTDFMRVEKVAYSDRVMRFAGTVVQGQELTEEMRRAAQGKLTALYCGNNALRKAKVSVEYAFTTIALRNINDKLKPETLSISVRPENCS